MTISDPLVTVWCSTYNHEKYIADAIEGFLKQETDFPIEIFIHDDASTDRTPEIIREYAERDERIVPVLRETNGFSLDNTFLNRVMFSMARGKYIAMCEGDDYWTDPQKLQNQAIFLESNGDYSGVAGATQCYI